MDRGFGFVVFCAPARLLCVTPLHVLCLYCVWSTIYVHIDRFTFLIIYHWACYLIISQVVNVVVVGPVQFFPFPWFRVCKSIFLLLVALFCSPVFSRTICLRLNLQYTALRFTNRSNGLEHWYTLSKSMACITYRLFIGHGAVGFVCSRQNSVRYYTQNQK